MRKQIVMIGTAREARSGIAAVVNVYVAHGLFRRWRVDYTATHSDGSMLRKAAVAAKSWLAFMARLLGGRVALLHVLAASDASFWRKLLFILPAHALGVPYLLHMHCGKFSDFHRRSRAPVRQLIRYLFRRAEAVVALSGEWREALSAIEPRSRVLTAPNPITLPDWQASLRGVRPTVLYLGLLKEAKGVHDLLRAWPAVLEAVPDAQLILGGSGDLDAVRVLTTSLGIDHSVQTPGWVVDDAKAALLRRAWIFALPSHAEALPMSILECMAAGIPVVASRVGGIPLAVDDGKTGHLIDPRDGAALSRSLIGLLIDEPRRLAMGHAARRRAAEQFSAEGLVPQIEALWRAIVPQMELARSAGSRDGTLPRTNAFSRP